MTNEKRHWANSDPEQHHSISGGNVTQYCSCPPPPPPTPVPTQLECPDIMIRDMFINCETHYGNILHQ